MTDTTTDRRGTVLERVRKLLDKAASTGFTAEADALRQKADELMARYAIQQFELRNAQIADVREVPEWRTIVVVSYDNPWKSQYMGVFWLLVRHTRCEGVWYDQYTGAEARVVGWKHDLDFLELLYTSVMMQIANALEPRFDASKSAGDNIARLKHAGMTWDRISELTGIPNTPGKLFGYYQRWCKVNGQQPMRSNPKTYQRSFLDGFWSQLGVRLRQMRSATTETLGSSAVVLADRHEDVMEAYYQRWPHLRPQPVDPDAKPKKSRLPARPRDLAVDMAGWAAGANAAAQADLSGGRGTMSSRRDRLDS